MTQDELHSRLVCSRLRYLFFSKTVVDPITFVRAQPGRIFWPVRQKEQRRDSEKNGGRAFEQEEPPPSRQTEPLDLQ